MSNVIYAATGVVSFEVTLTLTPTPTPTPTLAPTPTRTLSQVTHHTAWLRDCDEVLLLRPGGRLAKVAAEELSEELSEELTLASAAAAPAGARAPPDTDARSEGDKGGKGGEGVGGRGRGAEGRGGGHAAAEVGGTRGGRGGSGGGGGGGSGRLVQREKLARGAVARSVWATYARALGPAALLLLLSIYAAQQGLVVGSSWWLTQWAAGVPACGAGSGVTCYAGVYVGLSAGAALLIWVRLMLVAKCLARAYRLLSYLLWLYFPAAPRARGLRGDARQPQAARGRALRRERLARRVLRRDTAGAHHQPLLVRPAGG